MARTLFAALPQLEPMDSESPGKFLTTNQTYQALETKKTSLEGSENHGTVSLIENGGDASPQAVIETWKKNEHSFHWSKSEHDHWAVEHTHRLHDAERKEGPARPGPRNVHLD